MNLKPTDAAPLASAGAPAPVMDSLDLLLLLALLPLHWTLFVLVVAQWFVRRNPHMLAGLLTYAGAEGLKRSAPARDESLLSDLLDQQPQAPALAPAAAKPDAAPLAFTDWRGLVLAAHNVIVVGVPQSGKSTLTRAFLPALAQRGHICLVDPHDRANDWPWQALGSGRDYAAIVQALAALTGEMTRRYQQRGAHTPLTVVIDEVPSITLHIKREWETHYPQLVFEGAKVGIKTWILTQSAQVRPLGLEGKGDLRDSLLFLYLGQFAIEQCPASAAQPYPAAIEYRGEVRTIDTSPLPTFARLPVGEQARWASPAVSGNGEDNDAAFETGLPDERASSRETGGTGSETGSAGLPQFDGLSDEAVLVTMMQRGLSQNVLCQFIGGNKVTAIEQIKAVARRYGFEKYL